MLLPASPEIIQIYHQGFSQKTWTSFTVITAIITIITTEQPITFDDLTTFPNEHGMIFDEPTR